MKVCFLQTELPNEQVLNTLKKMTPGRSGKWKDMVGVTSIKEADYCVIIDYTIQDVPAEKAIYIGAHPRSIPHAYINMDDKQCFAKLDCEKVFGFGEWWIEFDYDYLSKLGKPKKVNKLCSIVSNVDTFYNHKARRAWLARFVETKLNEFNLYGRIEPFTDRMRYYYRGKLNSDKDHMGGKEEKLLKHKYVIEFDNDAPDGHYFSERVFDDLLMWCMPIYWGGGNLHKYIPKESFRYLDINDSGESVYTVLEEDPYSRSMEAIAEARNLLLNKWQIWPRVYNTIKGTN